MIRNPVDTSLSIPFPMWQPNRLQIASPSQSMSRLLLEPKSPGLTAKRASTSPQPRGILHPMNGERLKHPSKSTKPPSIARSAALLSLGNVSSRVLGLVREQVISYFFGATVYVSSFRLSDRLLKLLYDFIIGGMLSGALVPVFSEYAGTDREALWQLASILLTFITALVALIVLLIEWLALPVAHLLAAGQTPEQQAVTALFFRLMAPAIFIMSISSILLALLYALKRFRFAAMATAVYNLGLVIGVPLLVGRFDAFSLALGVLLGATFQMLILLPDVRDVRLRLSFYWRHPGVRRIVILYFPIAISLIVGLFQGLFDGRLATFTGPSSLAYMANATALVQFPLGLVATAISYAALPTLSQLAATGDMEAYRHTLDRVLRMVLFLSLPAAVGLFVLAHPVIRLVYEHGAFSAGDTLQTARVLRVYAIGLIFAAVDWPLNYAYYARQNTRTPTLVGIAAVGVYMGVALTLMAPLGMVGLVWGDTSKHFTHAMTMLALTRRSVGHFGKGKLGRAVPRIVLAAGLMGAAVWSAWQVLLSLGVPQGTAGTLLGLVITVALGAGTYAVLTLLLGLEEARGLAAQVRKRLAR